MTAAATIIKQIHIGAARHGRVKSTIFPSVVTLSVETATLRALGAKVTSAGEETRATIVEAGAVSSFGDWLRS
jgi:hypothetical protein